MFILFIMIVVYFFFVVFGNYLSIFNITLYSTHKIMLIEARFLPLGHISYYVSFKFAHLCVLGTGPVFMAFQ